MDNSGYDPGYLILTDTDLSLYDQPFMSVQIPEKLDPWRAARSSQSYKGALAARMFTRIPSPGRILGPVQVRLKFRDFSSLGTKRARIDLYMQATATWICQRCLEPLQWPQTVSRTLLVMEPVHDQTECPGDIETGADEGFEVITVARGELLSLTNMIEDELLLALPLAPMHRHCEQIATVPDVQHITQDNPFAVLAHLRDGTTHK